MKKLLTGNEAVARGAYEAGVAFAAAYPGTPSTEILENIGDYAEIIAEWAPNEKVALESAVGAAVVGARALSAMKHVGVNVAADPLFSVGYSGVNGGLVLVSADDPGTHSSQDEQDNRYFAKFAKVAMLEPSNSQECKDMVGAALEISEQYDTLVLLRLTTRICHSKSLVEFGERQEKVLRPYVRNLSKYSLVPHVARNLHLELERKLQDLEKFANETALNFVEWNDKQIGVISSGVAYEYAREVFGESASYLKLGFTHPLPMDKIRAFAKKVGTLYVVEELEPYLEDQIRAAGIACVGKDKIPNTGELNPDIIAKALLNETRQLVEADASSLVNRPPTLCAGCPHRGFFYELAKRKDVLITGDIGCYGLGGAEPLNAQDTCICMGASISMGHGAQQMFNKFGVNKRTVATIGDSTFFHSGINSLLDVVYNGSKVVTCILDNRITAMTGHQDHPGSGRTLQGKAVAEVDIASVVKGMGVAHVRTVNPLQLAEVREALDWALGLDEPAVIITRWPCLLKKLSAKDVAEFGGPQEKCAVSAAKCVGCKVCLKTGCPALRLDNESRKVMIDDVQCAGCGVCLQACPAKAIGKAGV